MNDIRAFIHWVKHNPSDKEQLEFVTAIETAIQQAILEEREACAKIAEWYQKDESLPEGDCCKVTANTIKNAIRARGEKK